MLVNATREEIIEDALASMLPVRRILLEYYFDQGVHASCPTQRKTKDEFLRLYPDCNLQSSEVLRELGLALRDMKAKLNEMGFVHWVEEVN